MKPMERFQELLRELFQFDCADLDFGIYRIMNYKRDVIEQFIMQDLPKAITEELDRGALADQSQAAKELKEVADQISQTLGKDALDADGNLAQAYHETPLGKKYLDLKAKAAGGRGREALEATIFNHLYAFFNRYYQDGDFISKRRYSKRQKYAIPYNGEEVYLYWANNDQYYVKTAEHFHDYTFTSRSVTVHFKLQTARVEQDNVKADKRFFLPRVKDTQWDEDTDQLVIPFEYRPLTEQEQISYGKKNHQDAIIAQVLEAIPKQLGKNVNALAALTAERRKTDKGESVSYLEHHLRQYTRRNTSDFFIHKHLKGFLSRELDFYLKNEVLNLDEMETAGEDRAEGWFQIMRAMKAVGRKVIAFLAQIENFQKRLFEKRKFVTETNYCITLGSIPEEFYGEIGANEVQVTEWRELYHIDEMDGDLATPDYSEPLTAAFLSVHPTLVVDTRHFDDDFTNGLLAVFDDLDEQTDGLLIHGENFQALSVLLEKYRGKIKCIYIDPPYNTGSDEFLYKDNYRHSTWMAMMQERVGLAQRLLSAQGVLFVSVDDNERVHIEEMLSALYGEDSLIGPIVVQANKGGRDYLPIAKAHEYLICCSVDETLDIARARDTSDYEYADSRSRWTPRELRNRNPKFNRQNRPNLFYPFYVHPDSADADGFCLLSLQRTETHRIEVLPKNSRGEDSCWRWSSEKALRDMESSDLDQSDVIARQKTKGGWNVYEKYRGTPKKAKSIWDDPKYRTENGTIRVRQLFGKQVYDFPKPVELVEDICRFSTDVNVQQMICDFFAGSGTTAHAVIGVNREDGSQRRFMLVEMADYFDTVLLPRIKKVTFTPEWKDGKPKRVATREEAERSPRIVKYIRLESYEDALNNIGFDDASGQQALEFEDYLLKYMLKWETRASETLLNVEKLARPFSYKLHIHADGKTREIVADIPETFNYLLGLHVQTRRVHDDDGRRYLVYRGRIDHRQIAVIWRETEGWQKADLERDKKFVAERKLAEGANEVFVNGDSFIPNARALEPVFKARMFSTVEA